MSVPDVLAEVCKFAAFVLVLTFLPVFTGWAVVRINEWRDNRS